MIVDCFSYFFGLESIKKYLSKKTIVVETIIETDDIPIPSVLCYVMLDLLNRMETLIGN